MRNQFALFVRPSHPIEPNTSLPCSSLSFGSTPGPLRRSPHLTPGTRTTRPSQRGFPKPLGGLKYHSISGAKSHCDSLPCSEGLGAPASMMHSFRRFYALAPFLTRHCRVRAFPNPRGKLLWSVELMLECCGAGRCCEAQLREDSTAPGTKSASHCEICA